MIHIPRGTQDILPEETTKWRYIENQLHKLMEVYNYQEIRTPIFESTDLFARGVGDSTDVVQKEMYTFKDKGDRSITLRPEGTAAVVRSYIENKMQGLPNQPVKLYYNGPMFRYERKQKGRFRQFNQFGVEAIGAENPSMDAEVLAMVMHIYQSFGLKKLKLVINSVGDAESRVDYQNALREHFQPVIHNYCKDCQQRIKTNPMRILDCKVDRHQPEIQTAPSITDFLNDYSKDYFEAVKSHLDRLGVPYEVDPKLVRGLDYYTHTAFELMMDNEAYDGAITTLCGGGRYNGLLELLDGPSETGIGFALSIERLLLALEEEGIEFPQTQHIDLFVATMGEKADDFAVTLLNRLRHAGISVDKDYLSRKLKGQMKQADRLNATYTIVIGDQELEAGEVAVKHMATGESRTMKFEEIESYIHGGKE
ncbi:histidine--tRNA ligase [Staphylococcus pseudintermedius]|uniref:histidine--tRNA ligase n=1 Tax=Staphylococcus pseudintermedius TaxID=283734 RepID=UPI0008061D66|nr:histidine--tRNA ligase [Staphylococcus pseudintermedius]ANQ81608.1 histidine--tRNA ligase [Staphylococcus pseudintermedius]EGQ0303936.1 histidine--tRNA ligase [Staphylococcus pseudintermedius]EGQ3305581.1 histidine--tRNA ligase [Staphylococcus pseudintermedius]EGQ3531006.1 histidine--tRNA ligase [Staphylococcus pseudintermedius]EGQ3677532.1 histidine--tRNA ligase [Staphylococcus pseudintermedius]